MTTLIEKLRDIGNWKPGDPPPKCVGTIDTWGYELADIAREAAEELDKRRSKWVKPHHRISDAALREIWRKGGGEFNGPNLVYGVMSERKLLRFLRMLIEGDVVP